MGGTFKRPITVILFSHSHFSYESELQISDPRLRKQVKPTSASQSVGMSSRRASQELLTPQKSRRINKSMTQWWQSGLLIQISRDGSSMRLEGLLRGQIISTLNRILESSKCRNLSILKLQLPTLWVAFGYTAIPAIFIRIAQIHVFCAEYDYYM